MTRRELLKLHAFTAGLDDARIARLAALARETAFAENQLVLRTGQQSKFFYLLTSGSVCVEVCSQTFAVCIQSLGPGDAFGWSAMLDRHDTLFQVRAREPSMALCFSSADLAACFHEDPQLAVDLLKRTLKLVATRVHATEVRLGELCGLRMTSNS